jgi:hypothetical protein
MFEKGRVRPLTQPFGLVLPTSSLCWLPLPVCSILLAPEITYTNFTETRRELVCHGDWELANHLPLHRGKRARR